MSIKELNLKKRFARESYTVSNELVLPNDTNMLNTLMGGRMMYLMDVIAAIAAQKHSQRVVVTASMDNLNFAKAIKLGSTVSLHAKVTRAFTSSMEVYVEAYAEDHIKGISTKTHEAFLTFVAVDQNGRPITVPEVVPETEQEKELYAGALRRRELRLILAGKMKPGEANELKSLFDIDAMADSKTAEPA